MPDPIQHQSSPQPAPRHQHRRRSPAPWCLFALVFLDAVGVSAQLVSVPTSETLTFTDRTQVERLTVDLDSLPNRPILFVDAHLSGGVPDVVIGLKINGFRSQFTGGPGACPGPSTEIESDLRAGLSTSVSWSPIGCDPRIGFLTGKTVDVAVRIVDFGSNPAPLRLAVEVRAESRVPNALNLIEFEGTTTQQTLHFGASQDTTLYRRDTAGSNGRGFRLWAGTDRELVFQSGGQISIERYGLRSLLAFDLSPAIPDDAFISDANLVMNVRETRGNGNSVSVHRVAQDGGAPPVEWLEGSAEAPGNEYFPGFDTGPAATWVDRLSPNVPWAIPGGDPVGPFFDPLGSPLDTLSISGLGDRTFSSTGLTQAARDMIATGRDEDGFLLVGSDSEILADGGVSFASSRASGAPEMIVVFTPAAPYQADTGATGSVTFINEGENLRWIYDLDEDDVFETDIGGICTVTGQAPGNALPYSYQFTGTPGYTGLDCCTWHLDSPETGTLGTGQAIFFHNLDASIDNLPPDSDGDGIRDNCDNCIAIANGPLLGSCLGGSAVGALCNSDLECPGNGVCSMSQEDADGDFQGDACVPEPGFAGMLLFGGAAMAAATRRRGEEAASSRTIPQ